jgi:hypothetical protein
LGIFDRINNPGQAGFFIPRTESCNGFLRHRPIILPLCG